MKNKPTTTKGAEMEMEQKTYSLTYDYNLNIRIDVKANNFDDADDIARDLVLDKIGEMLKVGNDNEHEIDFQNGCLENWNDDECNEDEDE